MRRFSSLDEIGDDEELKVADVSIDDVRVVVDSEVKDSVWLVGSAFRKSGKTSSNSLKERRST